MTRRSLSQTWSGGAGSLDNLRLAIEIKRQEALSIGAWWAQARAQADDRVPVLTYRRSWRPCGFVAPLSWVAGVGGDETADLSLAGFCHVVRTQVRTPYARDSSQARQ